MFSRTVNLLGTGTRDEKIADGRLVNIDVDPALGFTAPIAFTKNLHNRISLSLPIEAEVAASKLKNRIEAVLKPARTRIASTPDGVTFIGSTCTILGSVVNVCVALDGDSLIFGEREDF